MSTNHNSIENQSSCSEDEGNQLTFYPITSSIDIDADESDNGSDKKSTKSRRFQKTRKSSNSSLPQKTENNHNSNNEQQTSSSNDDEQKKSDPILNGSIDRRTKTDLI